MPPRSRIAIDTDQFAKRLCILKPYRGGKEKGVLKVKFSETFRILSSAADFPRLCREYRLVLEPSWTGVAEPGVLQFAGLESEVVVLTGAQSDYDFLMRFGPPFAPLLIGPCDWVDPRHAEPFVGIRKEFDIVLNSLWASWKRHEVLFSAMQAGARRFTAALIGVPWQGCTKERVVGLARAYGVEDQIRFFERIPYSEVMRVTAASRVAVLMSLKEGGNRSLAEAMFCDVPVVILDTHWGGITKNVVPQTGESCSESALPATLADVIDHPERYRPRSWATDNISCVVTTEHLNTYLKALAKRRGEPWTEDIVIHSNSPECTYFQAGLAVRFAADYDRLREQFTS